MVSCIGNMKAGPSKKKKEKERFSPRGGRGAVVLGYTKGREII
jgi:hypothetical protein